MVLIETRAGLPNSCFVCGKHVATETWFTTSVDAAISGQGGHKKCLEKHFKAPEPEPEPEPAPEPEE